MARKGKKQRKHVPQRTCVGCRAINANRELVRIVRTPKGVVIDPSGKLKGRGAYLHASRSCWQRGLSGSISHALKTEINAEEVEQLTEFMLSLPEGEDLEVVKSHSSD